MGSCSFKMPPDFAHGAGLPQNDTYYRSPRVKRKTRGNQREMSHNGSRRKDGQKRTQKVPLRWTSNSRPKG